MNKRTFYMEYAYILGVMALAFGTALMEAADYGISMVVAPAYTLYLKVSQAVPFFSFGMAEYITQAILLLIMILVLRKFRVSYLFSFVTAIIYGLMLDASMTIVSLIPMEQAFLRLVFYIVGLILCALGVSLIFHTYIAPEVYELFVKEVSTKYGINIHKFKTAYDCISCLVGILLSFAFFGLWQFEGVKLGTIVCALVNGWIISKWTHLLEKHFDFKDARSINRRSLT